MLSRGDTSVVVELADEFNEWSGAPEQTDECFLPLHSYVLFFVYYLNKMFFCFFKACTYSQTGSVV